MATRAKSIVKTDTLGDDVRIVTWAGLTQATLDDGDPFEMPGWADRTVQVIGNLGTGGSVRIEGSLDGTNFVPLTDPQGNALDVTTLKIESVSELTRYIRPRITAGDAGTDLTVMLLARRT